MSILMEGISLAKEIKDRVRTEVQRLNDSGIEVGLALLLVGDNPSSRQYYLSTLKASKRVGIRTHEFRLSADASINEILNTIHQINRDERINGLLVLFPLPPRINARRVVNEISPEKDIDGLGALSIGRLSADESTFQLFQSDSKNETESNPCIRLSGITGFLPCTPYGVVRLLEYYDVPLRGKHAVVIGKSLAVGKPLSMMLLAKDATVTVCHKETADLGRITRQADIICSATGVRGLITREMVKEGAVIVDIGINVLKSGKIVGDVEFDGVKEKASFITPVPGGVGPVTIAMLLENTLMSAMRNEALNSPFQLS